MKKYYADKTCSALFRIILLAVTCLLIFCAYHFLHSIPILMWVLTIVFATAYLLFGVIWLPLYFSKTNCSISSTEIVKNSGIFWQTKQIMPMESVQYATLITTFFSKYTGFNFVIVNALGGNIMLMFLSSSDAEEIMKTIRLSIDKRKTI